jgi:hypothetical protein
VTQEGVWIFCYRQWGTSKQQLKRVKGDEWGTENLRVMENMNCTRAENRGGKMPVGEYNSNPNKKK